MSSYQLDWQSIVSVAYVTICLVLNIPGTSKNMLCIRDAVRNNLKCTLVSRRKMFVHLYFIFMLILRSDFMLGWLALYTCQYRIDNGYVYCYYYCYCYNNNHNDNDKDNDHDNNNNNNDNNDNMIIIITITIIIITMILIGNPILTNIQRQSS